MWTESPRNTTSFQRDQTEDIQGQIKILKSINPINLDSHLHLRWFSKKNPQTHRNTLVMWHTKKEPSCWRDDRWCEPWLGGSSYKSSHFCSDGWHAQPSPSPSHHRWYKPFPIGWSIASSEPQSSPLFQARWTRQRSLRRTPGSSRRVILAKIDLWVVAPQPMAGEGSEMSHKEPPAKKMGSVLVGGWATTPLKNMSSSIGMMTFPIFMGK